MRYHDHNLDGYSVLQNGSQIILHLSSGANRSDIEFSNVVAYHFIHTGSAIITEISETPLLSLIIERKGMLTEWRHRHGALAHWNDDTSVYATRLAESGHKAWRIDSAIGFSGFIIGKDAKPRDPNPSP